GAFSGLRAKRRASQLGRKFPVLPGVWKHPPFFSVISGSAEIISVEKSQKNGWLVRLSNPGNTTEQLHFATTLDVLQAWECTLLEEKKRTLAYEDGAYVLELPPFSLRTIVFSVGKSKKC
ncbi:MAG: glycosyl hydrolase-related protein, partial [Sphaerochaetaceae bacterium]